MDGKAGSVGKCGYGAVAIGAQQAHAGMLVAIHNSWRRMAERILLAHGNDRDPRRDGCNEVFRRRRLAAVVWHLHEIGGERRSIAGELLLNMLLDVARQ